MLASRSPPSTPCSARTPSFFYGTESLSALLYAVERLRSVVRAGDESGFTALMEQGRAYLSGRRPEGA
jgi:hypothetical protein